MKRLLFLSLFVLMAVSFSIWLFGTQSIFAVSTPTQDVNATESINSKLKLWYTSPAEVNTSEGSGGLWMQQALPLGNGDLGNLIFGGVEKDRVHVNQKTLWSGGPAPSRPNYQFGNKQTAYTKAEIEEYRQILDDKSTHVFNDANGLRGRYGMGSPIRFPGENNLVKGEYQDFGDVWLDFSAMGMNASNVENYRRELDLQTGIAKITFDYKGTTYTREHFVSAPDGVMVTRLSASKPRALTTDIAFKLLNGGLSAQTTVDASEGTVVHEGTVRDNGLQFYSSLKVLAEDGELSKSSQGILVEGASSILLVMDVETNYKNDFPTYRDAEKNLRAVVEGKISTASHKGYEELKSSHVSDHQALFDRVELDLNEDRSGIPTNELVDTYRAGEKSQFLEVLAFQFGRYLSIAGSRGELPSNLVGLWTVGRSAWTGDYHFNVNVQMNYWPVYVTNLSECGTTFVNYMENLRKPGRLTAEHVHGIEGAQQNHQGFTVHTENNPFGMTAPTNAQEYGWNPTGAAWAIQNIWQHYEFTGDKAYLQNTLYPIMKEAALFWDNYLWTSNYQTIQDEASPYNGEKRMVVAPSFSEEQGPTVVGATYDQSLVWELYKMCIEAGKIVGEDPATLAKWTQTIQKLDPININATGGIKEWYEETRVGTESGHHRSYAQAGSLAEIPVPNSGWNIGHPGEHRHASHLVGLYPGTLINKDNAEVMRAAVQSLTERDVYSTGWSKANKVNLWARTGNGDKAYTVLKNLIGGKSAGLQYNLFDSHGTGGGPTMFNGNPVWQIDGNYGLSAGVAEMLVQSQLGYTQFLPALPDAWSTGSVRGLKARGNFTIDQKWTQGLATTFTVQYEGPEASASFVGQYPHITQANVLANGQPVAVTKHEDSQKIEFVAQKGVEYTIDMRSVHISEFKKQAQELLTAIHPDLTQTIGELREALEGNNLNLPEIIQKTEIVNKLYRKARDLEPKIYLLSPTENLSKSNIDEMHVELFNLLASLKENNQSTQWYRVQETPLDAIHHKIQSLLQTHQIVFSKDSGLVQAQDQVTLSKHAQVPDGLTVRYTTDGTSPTASAQEYTQPIQVGQADSTVVKAGLFKGDQLVSEIFTKSYTVQSIPVSSITTSAPLDWGETYNIQKAADGNSATRYASKSPQGPVELTLTLPQGTTLNSVAFDFFVSNRNAINEFEIQAQKDGEYQTVYTGSKMGDIANKVGDVDPGSGGYHAYYIAKFDPVTTDSIKIILKAGYVGEPSFYEIRPISVPTNIEQAGNTEKLAEALTLAKAIDRTSQAYQDAPKSLRDSFEASIQEFENTQGLSQVQIDNRTLFLMDRYQRLGFGTTDLSELEGLIERAQNITATEYTRDSVYRLNEKLEEARAVLNTEDVKQPLVDSMAHELQKALRALVPVQEKTVDVASSDLQGNGWIDANGGFKATETLNTDLSYTFTGNRVRVKTVKASDHGIITVSIKNDNHEEVFRKTFDTYTDQARQNDAELFEHELDPGTYTIVFTKTDVHPQAGRGWVEVKLSYTQPFVETVDRSSLKTTFDACENLQPRDYTADSWSVFAKTLENARAVFELEDGQTSTAHMEATARALTAAKTKLVRFEQGDTSQLEELLRQAKALKAQAYVAETFEALQTTIREIETRIAQPLSQNAINELVTRLQQALNELKADKTELASKVAELARMENLTDESKAQLDGLLEQARAVLAKELAMPSEVSQALSALKDFTPIFKSSEVPGDSDESTTEPTDEPIDSNSQQADHNQEVEPTEATAVDSSSDTQKPTQRVADTSDLLWMPGVFAMIGLAILSAKKLVKES